MSLVEDGKDIQGLARHFKIVSRYMDGKAYACCLIDRYIIIGFKDGQLVQLSDVFKNKKDAWKDAAEKIGIQV